MPEGSVDKLRGLFKKRNPTETPEQVLRRLSLKPTSELTESERREGTAALIARKKLTEEEKKEILEQSVVVDSHQLAEFAASDSIRRKFVREGERIITAPSEIDHLDLAVANGMTLPGDAGQLTHRPKLPHIEIEDGSLSLLIKRDNPQRPETLQMLQRLGAEMDIIVTSYSGTPFYQH